MIETLNRSQLDGCKVVGEYFNLDTSGERYLPDLIEMEIDESSHKENQV